VSRAACIGQRRRLIFWTIGRAKPRHPPSSPKTCSVTTSHTTPCQSCLEDRRFAAQDLLFLLDTFTSQCGCLQSIFRLGSDSRKSAPALYLVYIVLYLQPHINGAVTCDLQLSCNVITGRNQLPPCPVILCSQTV